MHVDKGQIWRFNGASANLISQEKYQNWVHVTITWVDNDNVFYRKDSNPGKVEQTPLVRFLEIAEFVRYAHES